MSRSQQRAKMRSVQTVAGFRGNNQAVSARNNVQACGARHVRESVKARTNVGVQGQRCNQRASNARVRNRRVVWGPESGNGQLYKATSNQLGCVYNGVIKGVGRESIPCNLCQHLGCVNRVFRPTTHRSNVCMSVM